MKIKFYFRDGLHATAQINLTNLNRALADQDADFISLSQDGDASRGFSKAQLIFWEPAE